MMDRMSADVNPAYTLVRHDVLGLVPAGARTVLDVGCSTGALGCAVKARQPARVVGLEISEEAGRQARECLDEVIVGDVETMDLDRRLGATTFDCIILADILEHLRDPWRFLGLLAGRLARDGVVVASIPNVRHASVIFDLAVRGLWPYRDRGIHDRTHLRFFTRSAIGDLFRGAGLAIVSLGRTYRIVETEPRRLKFLARLNRFRVGLRCPDCATSSPSSTSCRPGGPGRGRYDGLGGGAAGGRECARLERRAVDPGVPRLATGHAVPRLRG
jgi:SAM-dependent methyltransferase